MNEPLFFLTENDTVKTWNPKSPAMLAAIAVYRAAYKIHPVNADTFDTGHKAQEAARKAGASYGDAANLAVVAWDLFSKETRGGK